MESGYDNSLEQDTATFTKELEKPAATRMMILWWKEENWPTLKKSLDTWSNPAVNGVCDEDTVPQMTVTLFLQNIGSKPITFYNDSPPRNQALLSQRQVTYVGDIFFTRDTENLGISMREVIQMISDIGQSSSYVQAENHLD